MLTIGQLGIRDFMRDVNGGVIKAVKNSAPVSVMLPNDEFMNSKPYWTNNKIVTANAHDVMEDIKNIVGMKFPENGWGHTYVYRDKVDAHGYIDTAKADSIYPVLHPDVPISDLAFSRVITKMVLFGDDKYNAAICMKWEPKQIQIAIGTNVRICDNFNILGADTFIETNRGLTYENLRLQIVDAIGKIEGRFNQNIETINRMIETPVSAQKAREVIGDLVLRYDTDQPIVNFTEIHDISREIAKAELKQQPIRNVWDLVNIGTDVLKFDRNAGETSFEHIRNWNQYTEKL